MLRADYKGFNKMLPLSLVLIALGLIIVVYSIVVDARSRRMSGRGKAPQTVNAASRQAEPKAGADDTATHSVQEEEAALSPTKERGEDIPQSSGPSREARDVIDKPRDEAEQSLAVLYEDRSGIIDYDRATGMIDTSIEGYRRIRRVGDGAFAIEWGGITFRLGKKRYRFDFSRLSDMKAGDAHVALFLKGSDEVKLFIFKQADGMAAAALNAYRRFLEGDV